VGLRENGWLVESGCGAGDDGLPMERSSRKTPDDLTKFIIGPLADDDTTEVLLLPAYAGEAPRGAGGGERSWVPGIGATTGDRGVPYGNKLVPA